MPFEVAPQLFQWDGNGHCFVKKQPISSQEVDEMIEAFYVAEAGCIRYKGTDRIIQIRLVQYGEGAQCDSLPDDLQAQHDEMSKRRITSEYGRKGEEHSKQPQPFLVKQFKKWFTRKA